MFMKPQVDVLFAQICLLLKPHPFQIKCTTAASLTNCHTYPNGRNYDCFTKDRDLISYIYFTFICSKKSSISFVTQSCYQCPTLFYHITAFFSCSYNLGEATYFSISHNVVSRSFQSCYRPRYLACEVTLISYTQTHNL
jgi:hypothetical protein